MRTTITLLTILLLSFHLSAQDSTEYHFLEEIVTFLAADSLKGRATGTENERVAADFIYNKFKTINRCKLRRDRFQFSHDSVHYNSQNIVAFINNRSNKTIIFSAHYDHLGYGGSLSHSKGVHQIHNGADDNASGVALLLNLAKKLSYRKDEFNYVFIAHSGHELGLYGTKHFSENLKKKYKSIHLFVNFDMVGRLNTERKLYYDCSEIIQDSLKLTSSNSIHLYKSTSDRLSTLDTKWFVLKNIPSITFSTGRHIDYHKTSDDIEYISFNGIIAISNLLFDWIDSNKVY